MKTLIRSILLMIGAGIIAGCATSSPRVVANGDTLQPKDDPKIYCILPLLDANSGKYQEDYPQASEVMTSAVESALLKLGKHVGTDTNCDIQISGLVTAYYKGSFAGDYTTVGLDLKATDKKLGVIVWKTAYVKSTKWNYKYDPALLADEVASELLKKAFASSEK
jgi:hypothetical protein